MLGCMQMQAQEIHVLSVHNVQMTAANRSARNTRTASWSLTLGRKQNWGTLLFPLKHSIFNERNQKEHENLLGSEIYCVWEGFTSPTSILVILITLSTTKSFWIICHSLGHMRAILCKKKHKKQQTEQQTTCLKTRGDQQSQHPTAESAPPT